MRARTLFAVVDDDAAACRPPGEFVFQPASSWAVQLGGSRGELNRSAASNSLARLAGAKETATRTGPSCGLARESARTSG